MTETKSKPILRGAVSHLSGFAAPIPALNPHIGKSVKPSLAHRPELEIINESSKVDNHGIWSQPYFGGASNLIKTVEQVPSFKTNGYGPGAKVGQDRKSVV